MITYYIISTNFKIYMIPVKEKWIKVPVWLGVMEGRWVLQALCIKGNGENHL